MCLAQFNTHSFSALRVGKITPGGKMPGLSKRHTLPVLEFRSNFPVDATTFNKSGNSRNPKPQKSTCMIVHVRRRATACIPVVILYSSGHSGLSASGPPATSKFIILDSWVDGLWPVKYTAGTWALRGFPGKHAYCRQGWAAQTAQLLWALVQACAPAFSAARGGISQSKYTGPIQWSHSWVVRGHVCSLFIFRHDQWVGCSQVYLSCFIEL